MSWVLPVELFGVLDKVGFNPPSEIHLFGFSYVSTCLREMILRFSQKSRINIYTLSPCKSFWNSAVSRGHTPLWGETDGLPIVIHWGQPGKEYAQMLGEMPEAGTEFHSDFVESRPAFVLGRLQGEILNEEHDVNTPAKPDTSLVILGCAHVRHEVEVVANEIWQLIRNDNDLCNTSRERSDSATLLYSWQMEQISSPTKLIFVRFSRTCTAFHLTWLTYRLLANTA